MFHAEKNVPRSAQTPCQPQIKNHLARKLSEKIIKKNLVRGKFSVTLSLMNKNEIITLPNGEKAIQLWYGKIETVCELLLGLELAKLKLKTAEGWDISTLRLIISGNTHKLKELGVEVK